MTGFLLPVQPLEKEAQRSNTGPEDVVVQEVVRYFSTPIFKRFSTEEEYSIQIGSYRGRADMVLIDRDGTRAVHN